MNEIQSLIARAKKYLESADVLMVHGDFDSAASRVYYAMYYAVQAVLLTKGLTVSSHRGLFAVFGEHFVKSGVFPRQMGKELSRAFEKRQLGDYEHGFIITQDEASDLIERSSEFIDRIEAYLKTNHFLD